MSTAQTGSPALTPKFKFSEEARRFLMATTYGRGLPRAEDKSQIPLVVWTLSTSRIGVDGSLVEEFGPQYQLFVGQVTDITSEFLGELDTGKPVAFRLEPTVRRASSYFVSIDGNRLNIQPE